MQLQLQLPLPLPFYSGQSDLLALIARGTPLADTLERLALLIEGQSPGSACSILLLDPAHTRTHLGAAPSLPSPFRAALLGNGIRSTSGSQGEANRSRGPVAVIDIVTDPLWAPWSDLVQRSGLRACWSTPIVDDKQQVLGTFALYHPQGREPTALDLHLLEAATHLAGIAIQRQRQQEETQRCQARLNTLVEQHTAELQQTLLEQRALFDNTTVGILFVKDRMVQRCNRYLEEMLGYEPGELIGRSTRVYYASDEEWQDFGERSTLALQAGGGYTGDFLAICKDGTQVWCSSHGKYVDPSDPSRGTVWVGVDITERRIAEQTRQQLLLEYRAILENATVGITFTRERVFLHCSERFAEMYGYRVEELIGQPTQMVYPSSDHYQEMSRMAGPVMSKGERFEIELEMRRKDGSLFWCRMSAKAIDPQAPGKGAIFITEDISEQRQALAELQAIFDNHHVGVLLVKDGRIQRCNVCFERMLGYPSGTLAGRDTRELFFDEGSQLALRDEAQSAVREGRIWIGEATMRHAQGHAVHVSAHAKGVQEGKPEQGLLWVALDISRHLSAEQALREANVRLASSLDIVNRASNDLSQLGEFSGFLQACETEQEAYDCLLRYGPLLFPGSTGALYLHDGEADLLQERMTWGSPLAAEPCFLSSQCWGLRRGRPYMMGSGGLRCAHLGFVALGGSACLPLVAQGQTIGLLLICFGGNAEKFDETGQLMERLAVALSEQCGLALANIRLRETLRRQSLRDPLTGLYNRRLLEESLRRELARLRRGHRGCALAIVDIDHFKQFNDRFGHEAGDEVLVAVARSLERNVREGDLVCRLGGEEFVVLWTDLDPSQAPGRAERVLEGIRQLNLQHAGRDLGRVTASLGVALAPQHTEMAVELLAAADAALYAAKGAGRNRWYMASTAAQNPDPMHGETQNTSPE